MKYETTPIKRVQRITRKAQAKYVTDINKLNTVRILNHLYKRHEMVIIYVAFVSTWILVLVGKI